MRFIDRVQIVGEKPVAQLAVLVLVTAEHMSVHDVLELVSERVPPALEDGQEKVKSLSAIRKQLQKTCSRH